MNKAFNSLRYKSPFHTNKLDNLRIKLVLWLMGKNMKVLDIGCGDGFIMDRIELFGNQVEGVEISDNAIKRARKKGFKVHDCSLNEDWYPKIKSKFDVVFAGEILEHIFDTDRLLRNIKKILKKDGKLIITTPNIASLGRRLYLLFGKSPLVETTARSYDAGHIRYFTFDTLIKLLEENMFEIEYISSVYINFNNSGSLHSTMLAKLFPKLGSTIVIKARQK